MKPPILETGISTPEKRLFAQRGFTLFEILVVVIIVVITVSAIIFSTTLSRGDNDLKLLGNDLSKLIHLLYQEAIFENRNYAISLNPQDFNVLEYNGEVWELSDQTFFRKIKLGESRQSRLIIDDQEVSAVEPSSVVPHILILSSGEMTSFEWEINDSHLDSRIILQGDFLGNVLMLGPVPASDV